MNINTKRVGSTKRFAAYLIDWFIGSLFISFPMVMYYLLKTNNIDAVSNVNIFLINEKFGLKVSLIIGTLSFLLGIVYYYLIPLKNQGMTLGKKVFSFKIVKEDGSPVEANKLFIRQVIVFTFLEVYLYSMGPLLMNLIKFLTGINLNFYFLITLVLSIISCFMVTFRKDRRAIHDIIAKTKVIEIKDNEKDQRI